MMPPTLFVYIRLQSFEVLTDMSSAMISRTPSADAVLDEYHPRKAWSPPRLVPRRLGDGADPGVAGDADADAARQAVQADGETPPGVRTPSTASSPSRCRASRKAATGVR